MRIFRIILVSPGDVAEERDAVDRVVEETNRIWGENLDLKIQLWRWEIDAYPGFHLDGPQGLLDAQMDITHSDLVIGIFWKRFGTPCEDALSGTEHELKRAILSWKITGCPQVLVYFNQAPYTPENTKETEQWSNVLKFREDLNKDGLIWKYNGVNQFESTFRGHLQRYAKLYDVQSEVTSENKGLLDVPDLPEAIQRNELNGQIDQALGKHSVILVGGLSGSGKTYLVSSYLRSHLDKNAYKHIYWHDPSPEETLDSLLALIGVDISLSGLSTTARCKALIAFLRDNKSVLVIDNYHSVEQSSYSLLVRLFLMAGTPCRLILLSQKYVKSKTPAIDPFQIIVQGFYYEEIRLYLKNKRIENITDKIIKDLKDKTEGLPFAIFLFSLLVGQFGYNPDEILVGTMTTHDRIRQWFSQIRAAISDDAHRLLLFLCLENTPFNKGVVNLLSRYLDLEQPDTIFDELLEHYLVTSYSQHRWKVHELVAMLSKSLLDLNSQNIGHNLIGRYYLEGLPKHPGDNLSEDQFFWKVRAFRQLIQSSQDSEFAIKVLDELAGPTKSQGHYALFIELSSDVIKNYPNRTLWIDYHHAHCNLILGAPVRCLEILEPLLYDERIVTDYTKHLSFTRLYSEALCSIGQETTALNKLTTLLDNIPEVFVNSLAYVHAKSIHVWILTRLKNYTLAMKICSELLAEANNTNQQRSGAIALTRMAYIEFCRNDFDKAISWVSGGIELFRKVYDRRGEAWGLRILSECQLQKGEEQLAFKNMKLCIDITSANGECGIEHKESLIRMKHAEISSVFYSLIDTELKRINLATQPLTIT